MVVSGWASIPRSSEIATPMRASPWSSPSARVIGGLISSVLPFRELSRKPTGSAIARILLAEVFIPLQQALLDGTAPEQLMRTGAIRPKQTHSSDIDPTITRACAQLFEAEPS